MRCNCCLMPVAILLSFCTGSAMADVPTSQPVPFLVTLNVPDAPGKDYFDLDNPHSSFNVTIKNTSSKPQIIWKDWCSWGYYTVSLSVIAINGKTLSKPFGITKGGRSWAANFPDPQTLQPGEEAVRHIFVSDLEPIYNVVTFYSQGGRKVILNDNRLVSGPILPRLGGSNSSRFETIKAVAVFDTLNSGNAHYGVWSGQIVSAPVTFKTGL